MPESGMENPTVHSQALCLKRFYNSRNRLCLGATAGVCQCVERVFLLNSPAFKSEGAGV